MSRSTSTALKNLAALTGGIGLLGVAWFTVLQVARIDPFARFRNATSSDEVGVVLEDVDFRAFHGGKLVAQARVGQIRVMRDRSSASLFAITDGRVWASNGQAFGFDADEATYGYFSHVLGVNRGAHFANDEMDLRAPAFTYEENTKMLRVPGSVTGKLRGGDLSASNLSYNAATKVFAFGPMSWSGQVEDPSKQGKRRQWTFTSKGPSVTQGDVTTLKDCTASDNDMIIQADTVEWNQKADVLTATGNVRYFGSDANLICPKVVVYRKEGRSVLSGGVSMLIKPEGGVKPEVVEMAPLRPVVPEEVAAQRPPAPKSPEEKKGDEELRSAENLRQYPTTVLAQEIVYWYRKGERRATITGSPQARQELSAGRWRMVWADRASYDGEKARLKLLSREGQKDARLKDSLGDDFRATLFEISTKKGDDYRYAENLEGTTYVEEEEIPEKPGGGSPAPSLQGPIGR